MRLNSVSGEEIINNENILRKQIKILYLIHDKIIKLKRERFKSLSERISPLILPDKRTQLFLPLSVTTLSKCNKSMKRISLFLIKTFYCERNSSNGRS